jgi:hypothetical protein
MEHLFLKRAELGLTKMTKLVTRGFLSVSSVRALGIPEKLQAVSSLSTVYLPAWFPPILGLMR